MTFPIQTADEYFETLDRRFQPDRAEGIDVVFQLDLSGPGGREAYIAVAGATLVVGEGRHPAADLTLRTDAETWVRIANGAAHTQMTYLTGAIQVEGDLELTLLMRRLLPRYRPHHSDVIAGEAVPAGDAPG